MTDPCQRCCIHVLWKSWYYLGIKVWLSYWVISQTLKMSRTCKCAQYVESELWYCVFLLPHCCFTRRCHAFAIFQVSMLIFQVSVQICFAMLSLRWSPLSSCECVHVRCVCGYVCIYQCKMLNATGPCPVSNVTEPPLSPMIFRNSFWNGNWQ